MKYVRGVWHPELHWACEKCIIKAMCQDDGCFMTELFHPYCLYCEKNETCKEECETVKMIKVFNRLERNYGDKLKKVLIETAKEQSLLYKLSKYNPSEKSEFRWFP